MASSSKPSPVTNKQDLNRFFDFFSHVPEATHMLTWLYSDLGIPANYREMNGWGVHAFRWVNQEGQLRYIKYTWNSKQGVRGLDLEAGDCSLKPIDEKVVRRIGYARVKGHFVSPLQKEFSQWLGSLAPQVVV